MPKCSNTTRSEQSAVSSRKNCNRTGFPASTRIVSGVYPPFTVTAISCTAPRSPAAGRTAGEREKRKYHSTQTMAATPSAVTTSCAVVMSVLRALDAHPVEGPPHEHYRENEERGRERVRQGRAPLAGERHRELHCQQTEQGRELDDRVHGHRRRVLERIAHRIADHRRVVQRRAL